MKPSFEIKFKNKDIAHAARRVFHKVKVQSGKADGKLGAVFCQLKEVDYPLLPEDPGPKMNLRGTYLPPKWADRINRVLRRYHDELRKERASDRK